MNTMYSVLLDLPLFQGLSQEDFTNILGKVKLHFSKHKAGDVLIKGGDDCQKLFFLLKGELDANTVSTDRMLSFTETFTEGHLIEPEALFGLAPQYKATYIARTEISVMSIQKSFISGELFKYEVFRLNYVNLICSRTNNLYNRLWKSIPLGTENKLMHFFMIHCERPEGEKIFKVKMDDLATNLDDTRLNVSRALNAMSNRGLATLTRKTIVIPEMNLLAKALEALPSPSTANGAREEATDEDDAENT